MLDQHKLTLQLSKTINKDHNQWYYLSPDDPTVSWSHRYVKSGVRDKKGYELIADITTAHFKFKKLKPHDIYLDIIDGPQEYAIDDTGTILQNGGSMLDIYHSSLKEFNRVTYKSYPAISSYQNSYLNIKQICFNLYSFLNEDLSVLYAH